MSTIDPKRDTSSTAPNKGMSCNNIIDENMSNNSSAMDRISKTFIRTHIIEDIVKPKESVPSQKAAPAPQSGCISYVTLDKSDNVNTVSAIVDDDEILILDDIKQVQSFPRAEKEASYPASIAQPGDVCFSGGLLAPDGTLRHLGKWCKRGQSKGSAVQSAQGSSTNSSDLIAVGADGRGGKIKVLRSLNQSSESGGTSACKKRCKLGAKTSGLQPQGFLQIEHFFGKAGR